jgi:hypothetical protein
VSERQPSLIARRSFIDARFERDSLWLITW